MGIWNTKPVIRKLLRRLAKRPLVHQRGKGCMKFNRCAIYEARGWTRTRMAREMVRDVESDRRLGILPVRRERRQYLYCCMPASNYGARV